MMEKFNQGRPVLNQQWQVLVEGILAEDEGVPGDQVGAEDAGRQEDEERKVDLAQILLGSQVSG